MKNLTLTLIAICCLQFSFAQVKKVEYSTPFEEPVKGSYKVLQLTNGSTFFFTFNNEDGIAVTVYKPDRKLASRKVLSTTKWEPKQMKNATMEGIYEIGGQPVLFLQFLIDREPILYRIQLHPENGSIAKLDEIGRLPKYSLISGYAMAFGEVDPEDFIVEKDPYSDAYAVVHYNSFSKESDKRIELVHYAVENGEHVEINRSYYDAQNFKYTNYIGMTVNGDKAVHLAAYGYNTESNGGKDSRVIISRIRRGERAFTNVNLEFTDDFKKTEGLMNYNPETGMIQLMTLTLIEGKRENFTMVLINYIDPESLQIVKKIPLPMSELNAYTKTKQIGDYWDDVEFKHIPVNMILNNDNTTTILLEEKDESYINSSSTKVEFGRIGVITLDNAGKATDAYALKKFQIATGHNTGRLYHAKRGKGLWSYTTHRGMTMYTPDDNRSYYSFGYINTTANNTYIIYNDNPDNYLNGVVLTDNKKIKPIKAVSESVATYRKVINNMKIESALLYGRNSSDDQTAFCNVESAHFRKETGVYASLMVKRNKKEKKAYIAWVTFE